MKKSNHSIYSVVADSRALIWALFFVLIFGSIFSSIFSFMLRLIFAPFVPGFAQETREMFLTFTDTGSYEKNYSLAAHLVVASRGYEFGWSVSL